MEVCKYCGYFVAENYHQWGCWWGDKYVEFIISRMEKEFLDPPGEV